nr:hypothetical protein [Tanacetum cinerariifolium]
MFTHGLMQEHKIVASNVISAEKLNIQIGDFIVYKGKKYTINTVPDVVADHRYTYTITFEGPEYRLYDAIIMHNGDADFTYYGEAIPHLNLILASINAIDPGWTIGFVDATIADYITYVDLSCRTALTTIAEKFKLEYYIVNKEINLVKQAGNVTNLSFSYGMHNGLYSLNRKYISEKNVKTKIFAYGSSKNLPANYRNGAKRLVFEERFIANNINIYKEKQTTYTNEEIYPKRTSTVTSVVESGPDDKVFFLSDSSLEFNLNNSLIPGLEAKISFTSGELYGETFVITAYNNATKVITYKSFTNEAKITLPNQSFKAAVGDTFVLLDISLPQSYITAAEAELKAAAIQYTSEVSIPQVEYDLNIDILNMKTLGYELNPGDKVTVVHEALGVNSLIRVTQVTYPISFPEILTNNTQFTATIANFISYTDSERLVATTIQNKQNIRIVDRRSIELARRNTADFNDLRELTFDPDGYFDPGNIKPESIESGMISIKFKSQNFRLRDVLYQPNYLGNANSLLISAGFLDHLEIEIEGLGYSWAINSKTFSGLNPLIPYYVYAKCSRSALTGEWMISETPVFADETP